MSNHLTEHALLNIDIHILEMKQNYPSDSEENKMNKSRLFHDLCVLSPHLAYPPLHLHWWRCNHEHVVPGTPGSEKSRCLVSLSNISEWCCPPIMICVQKNLNKNLFLLLLDGIARTTLSPGTTWRRLSSTKWGFFLLHFFTFLLFWWLQKNNFLSVTWSVGSCETRGIRYVCEMRLASCYLASKSITAPSYWMCTFVCTFSSLQLTWTTPSWRKTGLIFKSTRHRSTVYGAFALFFFLPNTNLRCWMKYESYCAALIQLVYFNMGRGIIASSKNKMGNHLLTNWWVYFWLYCKLSKQSK